MGKAAVANQADEAILAYLKGANRPYSINDLINNLQSMKFTKSIIAKAMENLVQSGDVIEKLNNKAKYYFYSQDKIVLDADKLKEVEEKIKVNEQELGRLKNEISVSEAKIKVLKQHTPISELEKQLSAMKSVVQELAVKADELASKCENIDPEANIVVKKRRQVYVSEWKRRKRMANEMFGKIHENASTPKKALIEEIGIETDEDNGVALPAI